MQLDDYFEFEKLENCDRIRIKGTRIAIEYLLDHFMEGWSPEQILQNYQPNVTLEQVYATITYYLHNKEAVDAYIQRCLAFDEAAYQESLRKEPSDVVKRLRALHANKS